MGAMMRTVALMAALAIAGAARGDESARAILDRQRALDEGERHWSERREHLQMEVIDPRRAPRQMELERFDKRYPAGEERTIAYFSAPDTVKGTALLAIAHPDRSADQWLFLPETKRARRIGGEVRKQGFVGSDLSYHDLDVLERMPTWSESDTAARLRGAALIDGVACHVIELTPHRAGIGYQRIVVWLGRDDLVARQVELYETVPPTGWFGAGGADPAQPTRRVRQSDVRSVGRIPLPHRVDVETPDAGTKTTVVFTAVAFDQGLPDALFTQPALEWGRYP